MRATEHQFQTREQVTEYLREALAIVEELNPPGDLREVCFGKAVDLVAAKQVFFEQTPVLPNLARH